MGFRDELWTSFSVGPPIEVIGAIVVAWALLTAAILIVARFRAQRDAISMREGYVRERMQQLCPDGWSARIAIYGGGAPEPHDVPTPGDGNVCVDWAEYASDPAGHTAVAVRRRVWGGTITAALREMIADRELDAELEKIERRAIREISGGRGGDAGPTATGSQGWQDR